MATAPTPEVAAAVAPGKDLDTTTLPTQPISVSQSATPDALWTATRYLITLIVAFAAGKGWISKDDAVQIPMLIAALVPVVLGIKSAIQSNKEKNTLEPFAPVEVAVRK